MRNKLTAVQIKKAGDGKLFDGGGLMLVKSGESGKWVFRYSHLGKRREMGLGAWPTLGLAEARKARDGWATELAAGRDPIALREQQQADEIAHRDRDDPTFASAVDDVFEAMKATLRDEGYRGRWRSPLDKHIIPKIGHKRLSELHQTDIRDALSPIWRTKHPTAMKAWRRTRIVLRESRLVGHGCDPFIADAAAKMLGAVNHKEVPIPATPWEDIPALYARLPRTVSGDCLRWIILTAVRYDGCSGARLSEIDGDVWTVPAERMKGREGKVTDFRVPLSSDVLALRDRIAPYVDDLMFPGDTGRAISSAALDKALNILKEPGRPHGFRTSFRTWVQDTDACAWEVSETILNHVIGNKVERAYARSDLLERRRPVMEAWARYVTGKAGEQVQSS